MVILAIGAWARFYRIDAIDWSSDHSDTALLAQDIYYNTRLALVGQPTSAVLPNSPFFFYPHILPLAFIPDPGYLSWFTAAWGIAAIALVWLIGFRYFGSVAAAVAGMAYAANPWVIGYSRTIWSGDHRAFFVLLGVLFGLLGFLEGKRWAQVLCLPVFLIGLQVHYAAWALIPLYGVLLWAGRDKISWRTLAISAGLALLVMLPFALGIATIFADGTLAPQDIQPQPRAWSLREFIKPTGQMFWLATGIGAERYTARANAEELLAAVGIPTQVWSGLVVIILLGGYAIWRSSTRAFAWLFALWVGAPLLAFTLPIIGIYPHYYIPGIPALALLTGIGAGWIWERCTGRFTLVRLGLMVALLGVFATQLWFWKVTVDYVDATYTPTQFGVATPVHYIRQVAAVLRNYQDVIFVTDQDWLEVSRTGSRVFAPFVRDTTVCLRDIRAGNQQIVLPAARFAAVFAPRVPNDPRLDMLYRLGTPTTISLRRGEGVYTIYSVDKPIAWQPTAITPLALAPFENGVQLTGYTLEADRLTLQWRLPAATKGQVAYAIESYTADEVLLASEAGSFWPGNYWCAGDQLITWHDLANSRQAATVRVKLSRRGMQDGDWESVAIALP